MPSAVWCHRCSACLGDTGSPCTGGSAPLGGSSGGCGAKPAGDLQAVTKGSRCSSAPGLGHAGFCRHHTRTALGEVAAPEDTRGVSGCLHRCCRPCPWVRIPARRPCPALAGGRGTSGVTGLVAVPLIVTRGAGSCVATATRRETAVAALCCCCERTARGVSGDKGGSRCGTIRVAAMPLDHAAPPAPAWCCSDGIDGIAHLRADELEGL